MVRPAIVKGKTVYPYRQFKNIIPFVLMDEGNFLSYYYTSQFRFFILITITGLIKAQTISVTDDTVPKKKKKVARKTASRKELTWLSGLIFFHTDPDMAELMNEKFISNYFTRNVAEIWVRVSFNILYHV